MVLLQQELARHGLFRAEVDGVFGSATAYAVVAFHKVLGVERTWAWEEADSLPHGQLHPAAAAGASR